MIGGRVDSPIGGGSTQQLFVVKITTIKCVHRGGKLINLHTIDTIFCQNMQPNFWSFARYRLDYCAWERVPMDGKPSVPDRVAAYVVINFLIFYIHQF